MNDWFREQVHIFNSVYFLKHFLLKHKCRIWKGLINQLFYIFLKFCNNLIAILKIQIDKHSNIMYTQF
jgi:hypothetical protein